MLIFRVLRTAFTCACKNLYQCHFAVAWGTILRPKWIRFWGRFLDTTITRELLRGADMGSKFRP